jgi:16S rRNA (uracil1498-N3)-methyltransferase
VGRGRAADVITVLVPPGAEAGRTIELDPEELHHLRVRRAAEESKVRVADGAGLRGEGVLRLDGKRALVSIERAERVVRPAALRLAVGAGERDRFTWLAEKATELGVTDLIPLETERTEGVASRVRDGQIEKLRRRALEAVKQCGALWATAVHAPVALDDFLAMAPEGAAWLADPAGRVGPAALGTSAVTAVVGPEGGFTEAERAAILAVGYEPVWLGQHVLRFETAALAAAVQIGSARQRSAVGSSRP